jgi:hypothetical protein
MSKSERKSNKEKRKPKADKPKTKTPAYLAGSEKPFGLPLDKAMKGSKK